MYDLKNIKLFEGVDHKIMDLMPSNIILNKKKAQNVIVNDRSKNKPNLYIIKSGVVVVSKINLSGNAYSISIKKYNDVFGFLSVIDEKPSNGNAVAITDCEYWLVKFNFIKEYLLKDQAFSINLLKLLANHIRNYDDYELNVANHTAKKKILFYLLELGNILEDENICVVENYINQNIISSFVRFSRETVNREIHKLKLLGIITINKDRTIHIEIDKAKKLLRD